MAKKESILDDLDEQLKKLEEELNRIDEDPRAYYDEMLRGDLEERASKIKIILIDGKETLAKLRKFGKEEFSNVKDNITSAKDNVAFTGKALRRSFNYFISQFKGRKKPSG